MKKNVKKIFTAFVFALVFLSPRAPVLAEAPPPLDYSGFVKCDGVVAGRKSDGTAIEGQTPTPGEEERQKVCNFAELVNTITGIVNWMFLISIPLATVLFAYGGILYMTGQKGKIDTAKKIFASVAIGFIIMLTAWVAVRTALSFFINTDSGATQFLGT